MPLSSYYQDPPMGVNVEMSTDQVHAGVPLTLTCVSQSSYPAANVTWWNKGEEIMHSALETKSGLYGGSVTT